MSAAAVATCSQGSRQTHHCQLTDKKLRRNNIYATEWLDYVQARLGMKRSACRCCLVIVHSLCARLRRLEAIRTLTRGVATNVSFQASDTTCAAQLPVPAYMQCLMHHHSAMRAGFFIRL